MNTVPSSRLIRRWRWGVALALLAPLVFVAAHYRLVPLVWYWSQMPATDKDSLRLSEYRVTLEAMPLDIPELNTSALTYNDETDTLYTTVNKPSRVVELSRAGKVLRSIPVKGVADLEGITHIEGERFAIIDEHQQQIYQIRIHPDTASLDVIDAPRLGLGILLAGNLGFEGVTWDEKKRRLFVAKEKKPLIFEIDGLPDFDAGARTHHLNLNINEWQPRQPFSRFLRDISSLSRHERMDHLLILSDESRLLVEYSMDGELVGIMPLWPGWHGLSRPIPQAEGIAVGRDETIYIISEPNLFYRFERHPAP